MKSHPQRALAPRRRLRASEFLNELGGLTFGDKWDIRHIKFLHSELEGTRGRSEAFAVEADFIEAMRRGMGTAEVDLNYMMSSLYPNYQERPGPGGRIVRRPPANIYQVDNAYWNSDDFDPENINWNLSTISFPSQYIIFDDIEGPFKLPTQAEVLDAPFYVAEPDLLLSRTVEIPPLATPEIINRYRETQRSIWLEVMGVTWRLLAIENPEDGHGLQADIIEKVRRYMRAHQLDGGDDERGVSDQTMEAVVSKILEQWRDQNTRDSVLVSSTPRSR